jgi:hypothetical protein
MTLEWADLWAAMKDKPNDWIQTTRKMYWEMLGCVPPAAQGMVSFLVGEPDHHNDTNEPVYACFRIRNGLTYARYMTLREYKADPTCI